MEMNKKVLLGIIIGVALGLGIYSYLVLPETVVVQVDLSGNPSNTYPKAVDIAIQLVLSIGGGLGYYFSKKNEKKYLILSIVGIIVSVVTLIYNT